MSARKLPWLPIAAAAGLAVVALAVLRPEVHSEPAWKVTLVLLSLVVFRLSARRHEHRRDLAPDRWVRDQGNWCHRPRVKVAINTMLRAVQPGSRKWLVFSRCAAIPSTGRPRAIGYGFGPIEHREPHEHHRVM